jgi:hypothetical protein
VGGARKPQEAAAPEDARDDAMSHELPKYPTNHKVGMRVPVGGSDCAKCEYVSGDGRQCRNAAFVKWNGASKLPAPANSYCCDFFEAAKRTTPRSAKELRVEK